GPKAAIARMADDGAVSVLNAVDEPRIDRARALRTTIIFISSLALAACNILPLPVAVLIGAFFIFLTRCIAPADAYREIEWRAIILIACMLALGEAMMR